MKKTLTAKTYQITSQPLVLHPTVPVMETRISLERRIERDLPQHVEDELAAEREYRAWVRANRPGRLSREQYCEEFGITA